MTDGYGYEAEDDDELERLAAAIQADAARIGQLSIPGWVP